MRFLRTFTILCLIVYSTGVASNFAELDDDQAPQLKAHDSIVATVTGKLYTVSNHPELYYAAVIAGGTEIELDNVDCPDVTRELLEWNRTGGGGPTTAVQIVAKGNLVFEKRPESAERRGKLRGEQNAVVPVLRVQSIKITILPVGQAIGTIKRDRALVKSSTFPIAER